MTLFCNLIMERPFLVYETNFSDLQYSVPDQTR